jgi:S-adenosylmethionine:tRNA ribosyltransferase-isomerase
MHTEQLFISRDSIERLFNSDKKRIAVGTTSVRTLESLYWIGVKMKNKRPGDEMLFLDQWEVYKMKVDISRKESMMNILEYMDNHKLQNLRAATKIMIVPRYDFKMIDGMITNFHQPNSTLLLLIAAFIGDEWRKIYDYAMNNDFRFLSYGDSSLLIK